MPGTLRRRPAVDGFNGAAQELSAFRCLFLANRFRDPDANTSPGLAPPSGKLRAGEARSRDKDEADAMT